MMLRKTLEKLSFASGLFVVLLCLVTLSGCLSNPNVDLCLFLTKENGEVLPFENWEIWCQNMRSGNQKNVPLPDGDKYFMVSGKDYDILREWYKSGCTDE